MWKFFAISIPPIIMNISSIPTPRIRKGSVPINATNCWPPAIVIPNPLPIPNATHPMPTMPKRKVTNNHITVTASKQHTDLLNDVSFIEKYCIIKTTAKLNA